MMVSVQLNARPSTGHLHERYGTLILRALFTICYPIHGRNAQIATMDDRMTYRWIEELLADLEAFSDLNNLCLLRESVMQARHVFRTETAKIALQSNVRELNSVSRNQRRPMPRQLSGAGEIIHLFNPEVRDV
jgi:hypothetical protein